MPQSHNQAEDERFILDKFFTAMNIQPDSIDRGPLVGGNNKPDFVVCIKGNRIGIEETTYYRKQRLDESQPRQAKENAWLNLQRVIEKARHKYSELSEIHGCLRFRDFMLPPSKEYDVFAWELAGFAMSKIDVLSSGRERYKSFCKKHSYLNRYLEYLELRRVGCYMFWDWSHDADYTGLQEDALYTRIQDKIDKHVQNQVSENWLLITSGTQMSQQMVGLSVSLMNEFRKILGLLHKCPFDSIYIYDYVRSKVLLWTMSKGWEDVLP